MTINKQWDHLGDFFGESPGTRLPRTPNERSGFVFSRSGVPPPPPPGSALSSFVRTCPSRDRSSFAAAFRGDLFQGIEPLIRLRSDDARAGSPRAPAALARAAAAALASSRPRRVAPSRSGRSVSAPDAWT